MGALGLSEELKVIKPLIKLRIAEYEARNGVKFNRTEAAKKMRISYSHLSGVISGTQQTTPENLFVLADMLSCKVDDLYIYQEGNDE